VWTEGANSTRGSVYTRVSTRAAATGVVPAPATGCCPPTPVRRRDILQGHRRPAGSGVAEAATRGLLARRRLQQIEQVAAVRLQAVARGFVRLQAVACGFLARRRLQKAHKQMQDREAALAAVAFAFDAEGCDLDSLDGYRQLCQSTAMSKGVHGVFPAYGVLQLYGGGGRGGVFLLIASGDALPSASAFRLRPPRGRLGWSSSRLLPGGCAPALLLFRWPPWDPGGCTHATSSCGWCLLSGSHNKKSESISD
jgi:hypothetical protein